MLHNLNAGNLMILYFDFYYGKEDFVLAYADVRTVRNDIKVNRANVQRLWTGGAPPATKRKQAQTVAAAVSRQGIAFFTFSFIRSPPPIQEKGWQLSRKQ